MSSWTCDRILAPENQWQASNIARYCNPAHDALLATMQDPAALDRCADPARTMSDMLLRDHVILPLVDRGRVSAGAIQSMRLVTAWRALVPCVTALGDGLHDALDPRSRTLRGRKRFSPARWHLRVSCAIRHRQAAWRDTSTR